MGKEYENWNVECKKPGFHNAKNPIRCAFYIPELWFLIGPEDD